MMAKIEIPESLLATGFHHHTEIAWQKKDLEMVFVFCKYKAVAIVGCEAWIVKSIDDIKESEPTEFIQNINPDSKLSLLARGSNYHIFGLFPLKNGQNVILSWNSESIDDQTPWNEFVEKTINETREVINRADLESEVADEYKPYIFYNLQFQLEGSRV